MAQSSLTPVEFHGATLATTIINGVPCVALRPICEAIGLDWASQLQRVKRHPVLSSSVVVITTDAARGNHTLKSEVIMLPLVKLNGWLFGISVGRVRPELRERLTRYQAECFDVLARHFGAAAPHQDSSFADPVNIHALPAPDSIDVRALLLDGQSDPTTALPPELQKAIELRAWTLAHEAYGLVREHLERRVAFHAVSGVPRRVNVARAEQVISEGTLGTALARTWHNEIRTVVRTAEMTLSASLHALESVRAAAQGQGAAVNPSV